MSWTLNSQTTNLVPRDDDANSDAHAMIVFLILFAGVVLVVPPMVFFSPLYPCGFRSKKPDLEQQQNQPLRRVRRPRTIAIRHPHGDSFVQIDIIDLVETARPPTPPPPPQSFFSHHCHQPQQQPGRFVAATDTSFKNRIADGANEAGKIVGAHAAAMSRSVRRGFALVKMKTSSLGGGGSGGGAGSRVRGAGRQRHRGMSIDLPVMKQPAWQRLASGELSPATSLGYFIQQAQDDAAAAAAAATVAASSSATTETYVDSHVARQARVDEVAETTVAHDGSRAAHDGEAAGVGPQSRSQSQGQVQKPEPVAVSGMGIAY